MFNKVKGFNPWNEHCRKPHSRGVSCRVIPHLHLAYFCPNSTPSRSKEESTQGVAGWERRVCTAHMPCLNPLQKKDMKLWYRCPPYTESPACCEERTYHAALSSFKMRRVGFGKGECSPGVFRLRCQRLQILLA